MITLEYAKQLADSGFSVLPAHRSEKRPTVRWQEFQKRLPTVAELAAWFPAARCCVVCGEVSGSLEILDFDQAGQAFPVFMESIPCELEAKLVYEQTPSGGYHILYRVPGLAEGNRKLAKSADGKVLIETRGEGGLFLCAPSAGYEFQQGDFSTIPTLSADEYATLIEAAKALNVATSSASPTAPVPPVSPSFSLLSPGQDFDQRGDMRPILLSAGWVCVTKGASPGWRRPGKTSGISASILRNERGNETLHVFSTNAEPLEGGKNYSNTEILTALQYGGDFRLAYSELRRLGYGEMENPPSFDHLMNMETELPKTAPVPENDSLDEVFYNVPGFIGDLTAWLIETAPRKQPEYALATALAAQSLLCNQNYSSPQGFRANIYCVVAGRSGSGKDWGRVALKEIFRQVGMVESVREKYQSYPAIQNDLRGLFVPKLWLWDECGLTLQSITSKYADGHRKDIIPGIMQIYTSSGSCLTPSIKADVLSQKNDYAPIDFPFLSVLGTSTQEELYEGLTRRTVKNGFWSRVMLFHEVHEPGYVPVFRHEQERIIPDDLLQAASWWAEKTKKNGSSPTTHRVEITQEAVERLNTLFRYQTEQAAECESAGDDTAELWSRCEEQAEKLALLYAVSSSPDEPCIDEQAASWGCDLATALTQRKDARVSVWVSDSPFDAMQNEVMRFVQESGGTVSNRDILRRFRRMRAQDRDEVLTNLVKTGDLFFSKTLTGGRPLLLYSLAPIQE